MRFTLTWLGLLLALVPATLATALDPRLDVGGFRDEDREVAEQLAGYDAEERHAALVAAGYPEDLLEISQIQSNSADAFAKLVDGLPREDQEQVWNLVRYPGLVADLARGGAKTDADLDRIAQRYPEEIRGAIRSEGRTRYATWVEIYAIDLDAEQAFASVIAAHPPDARGAFQRLRSRPDLMSLLADNVGVATRIGSAYREDPTGVEARFDGLHQDVAARRSEQEKSWAKEIQDPKKREELQTAAREFANEHGYVLDDQGYDPNNPQSGIANSGAPQTQVVYVDRYVNVNPYPYWFGYPSWYAYPYWYPASIWSHVGFRFGGGGAFVGIGLPSPYFLGWYNNFYYGGGYGFGYGGFGGGYGYGLGFAGWSYPGSYYWGGGYPYNRHYHSAHYNHQNPRTFTGNRPHHRYDTQSRSYASQRQAAQQRLMKGGQRQWNTQSNSGRAVHRFDRRNGSTSLGQRQGQPRSGGSGSHRVGPGANGSSNGARERLQRQGGPSSMRDSGRNGRGTPPPVSSGPPGARPQRDARPSGFGRQGNQGREGQPSFSQTAAANHVARTNRATHGFSTATAGRSARLGVSAGPRQLGTNRSGAFSGGRSGGRPSGLSARPAGGQSGARMNGGSVNHGGLGGSVGRSSGGPRGGFSGGGPSGGGHRSSFSGGGGGHVGGAGGGRVGGFSGGHVGGFSGGHAGGFGGGHAGGFGGGGHHR
jgi:hypothetical protein